MPGLLTGLLGGATAAATGYGAGEQKENDKNEALAMLMMQRQEQQRLTDARIGEYQARTNSLNTPKPVKPARDPVADHKAIRDYDVKHPLPSRARGAGAGSDVALARALSGTHSQLSAATHTADAAEKGLETDYPDGAPRPVDPTLPGSSGFLGIGGSGPKPNPAYPDYKADSTGYATAADRVKKALATRDSLMTVAGKLSTRLNTDAMGDDPGADDGEDDGDSGEAPAPSPLSPRAPRAAAAPRGTAPAAPAPDVGDASSAFQQAAQALKNAGGPSNAQARAQYDRVVAGISAHYKLTGAPGTTPAAPPQ